MATEIERKFLLATQDHRFLQNYDCASIVQGYLHETGMTTRVRIVNAEKAFLTLKGKAKGLRMPEYEYPLPLADAKDMLANNIVGRLVTKMRYFIPVGRHTWEVDVFTGFLQGLVVAEIEVADEADEFERPAWIGLEVTTNKAFKNKQLALSKSVPLVMVSKAA